MYNKVKEIRQYDIFQLWYSPESNRKIYCDLNGKELEKYARLITEAAVYS